MTIYAKEDSRYNPYIIAKLHKIAMLCLAGDNVVTVVPYGCLKIHLKTAKNNWWKEYGWKAVECKQDGSDKNGDFYVVYNDDGTEKEFDLSALAFEDKYALKYTDEYEYENKDENIIDENELCDKVSEYVHEFFEKEFPYRYHHMGTEKLLNQSNKMTITNTKNGKAVNITFRLIDEITDSIANENDGFAVHIDVVEKLYDFVKTNIE